MHLCKKRKATLNTPMHNAFKKTNKYEYHKNTFDMRFSNRKTELDCDI